MNVTVSVTQADIDSGVRSDCGHCPLARAVMRALQIDRISVGPTDMDLGQDGTLLEPPEAWLWLAEPHGVAGMDSAQALAHARACGECTAEIARLTGRRVLEKVA